jgi:NodT family efflux transporter outer membrane factor (OMF) lipoprotein
MTNIRSGLNKAAALGLAAVLAACASPEGLHPTARKLDAASLQAGESLGPASLSAAAWPTQEWWRRYGDPQLDALVAEALAHSPSLRLAQARIRQAAAFAGAAQAAAGPQLGASVRSNRQEFSEHGTTPPPVAGTWKWVNEASLNFSYEFDFWGKHEAAIEAAVGRTRAAEVDGHAARLVLVTGILRSYVRLQQAWQQRDIAEATLKQREHVLALTRQRVAARIDSALELKQAESQLPAARVQIAQLNEAIALARTELAALAGQGPDRGLALERPRLRENRASLLPSALPAELIGRRPDVVAQRWRAEAADKEIEVARGQFYPNISLTALLGAQRLGFADWMTAGSRIAGIGPAVSLPIFDAGRLRSGLAARNAEYDIAVEQYNATVVDAVRDVVSQLVSLRWLEEQRVQQGEALATTTQARELALQRYRAGIGNYLQVLAAESQLLATQRLALDLDMRAIELDASLARALGGGLPEQDRPVQANVNNGH